MGDCGCFSACICVCEVLVDNIYTYEFLNVPLSYCKNFHQKPLLNYLEYAEETSLLVQMNFLKCHWTRGI